MFLDWSAVRIFVRPGATDLRKQINGLAAMAQGEMSQDPFSGSLFLFCNKTRKILKALYWDRTGFCMWQKRLERHHFPWPKTEEAAKEIVVDQFRMVLDGIDFWNAHQKLTYSTVL
jgi:transposase